MILFAADSPPDSRPRYPLVSAGWCSALVLFATAIVIFWFYAAVYEFARDATTVWAMIVISLTVPWLGALAGVRLRRPALGVLAGTLGSLGLCMLLFYLHNAYCDDEDRIRADESFWRSGVALHVAVAFAFVLVARQVHRKLGKIESTTAGPVLRMTAKEGAKTVATAGVIVAFAPGAVLAMVIRPPERPMEYLVACGIWAGCVVAGAVTGAVVGALLGVWLGTVSPVLLRPPNRVANWLPMRWSSLGMAAMVLATCLTTGLRVKPYILNYLAISALFDDKQVQQYVSSRPRQGPVAKFKLRDTGVRIDSEEKAAAMHHIRHLLDPSAILITSAAVNDDRLAHLADITRLDTLSLESPALTDAGLEHLANIESISSLSISGTRITGTGFQHWKALPTIEQMFLSDNPIEDAGITHLSRASSLCHLFLDNTRISNAALESLSTRNQSVSVLDLRRTAVTDACIPHLKMMPSLLTVFLGGTKVSPDGKRAVWEILADRDVPPPDEVIPDADPDARDESGAKVPQ
jgi:hypothetical protein